MAKKRFKRNAAILAVGAFLGALSALLGYGAAGGLMLTILGGSLWLVFRSGHPRNPWVLNYCIFAVMSFYVFGYHGIYRPKSIETVLMLGSFVIIPWLVALSVDGIMQLCMKSEKRAEDEPE